MQEQWQLTLKKQRKKSLQITKTLTYMIKYTFTKKNIYDQIQQIVFCRVRVNLCENGVTVESS